MHRIKILITLLLCTNIAFAEVLTCPTVTEIKNKQFRTFLPLYIMGEELASTEDVERFKKNVGKFSAARWNRQYLEAAHCFYTSNGNGTDPIVNQIVFAQNAWRPSPQPQWSWIIPNKNAECFSEQVSDCTLIS